MNPDPATLIIVLKAVVSIIGFFAKDASCLGSTHSDATLTGIKAVEEIARLLHDNRDILTQREQDILFKYVRWGLDEHDRLPSRNVFMRPLLSIRFNVKARHLLNNAARVTSSAAAREYLQHFAKRGISDLNITTSIPNEPNGAARAGLLGQILNLRSRGFERRDQGNDPNVHQQGEVFLQCDGQTSSWKTQNKIRATIKIQNHIGGNGVLKVHITGWRLSPKVGGAEVEVQFSLDISAFQEAAPTNANTTDVVDNAAIGASDSQSIVDVLSHEFDVLASGVDDAMSGMA